MTLKAAKPELIGEIGQTIGARLRRRRRELGHRRSVAAKLLGIDPKSLMWWERDVRAPLDRFYPAVIEYLGHEPWPEAVTLPEQLRAERRRCGLSIQAAALVIGVDEGTLGRWEHGEWRPTSRHMSAIIRFLGDRIPQGHLLAIEDVFGPAREIASGELMLPVRSDSG